MLSKAENSSIKLLLGDEGATRQLGQDIAMAISSGCLIWLKGDLGAGKSFLARALIRHVCGEPDLEVPSPTFSIVQTYDAGSHGKISQVIHSDLYRLVDSEEVNELGISDAGDDTIILLEWPERGQANLPNPDLLIEFETSDSDEQRNVIITGSDHWINSVSRSLVIRNFLEKEWGLGLLRTPLQGDASTRSYEYISNSDEVRILMNAPHQADGPVIKDGKPYSKIAHLAEDVSAFVGVGQILAQQKLSVPKLFAGDLERGLLLLENLGSNQIVDDNRKPIEERYLASAKMLAGFHNQDCITQAELPNGKLYHLPQYDREAMLIEVDLLAKWYAPLFKGGELSEKEYSRFLAIWNKLIDQLVSSEDKLVLRDFHSPNIIWNEEVSGDARIGLIDFQDAVYGPSAYDLASLAQDARVDIPAHLEQQLVDHYCDARTHSEFNEIEFRRDYAIMTAQRATKILGIFVRLDQRDNKPIYLKHLPRMQDYIKRSMTHPVLAEYQDWYETVIGM